MPLLFALFWAGNHCEPVPQCQRANEAALLPFAAAAVAAAALFGFAVRALVRWAYVRQQDAAAAAPPPLWAMAIAVPMGLGALWLAGQMFFL